MVKQGQGLKGRTLLEGIRGDAVVREKPTRVVSSVWKYGPGSSFLWRGYEGQLRSRSESNMPAVPHLRNQGRGVKVPGVTGARPETRRSSPEQGEADPRIGGGPHRFCRAMRSDDSGLGVKGPSSLATAGSSRKWSQPCLARDSC